MIANESLHRAVRPYGLEQPRYAGKGSSSLNAGFISGSPRFNYGADNYKIPADVIATREQLREVAGRHGVDLRTAALQFSAAADVASAPVVGAGSAGQIVEDYTSMQTRTPVDFWAELKAEGLIYAQAPTPNGVTCEHRAAGGGNPLENFPFQ
ncbi:hypothetical protein ABLE91_28405 [Aquabacter sp. CN5-332]|uniref:hypothetical protein n=1 Tax=Aquabacter sp. CN5-332 TaxID=3156608 RepID=UPI0032B44DF3